MAVPGSKLWSKVKKDIREAVSTLFTRSAVDEVIGSYVTVTDDLGRQRRVTKPKYQRVRPGDEVVTMRIWDDEVVLFVPPVGSSDDDSGDAIEEPAITEWGEIGGDIEAQEDLTAELDDIRGSITEHASGRIIVSIGGVTYNGPDEGYVSARSVGRQKMGSRQVSGSGSNVTIEVRLECMSGSDESLQYIWSEVWCMAFPILGSAAVSGDRAYDGSSSQVNPGNVHDGASFGIYLADQVIYNVVAGGYVEARANAPA